MAHIHISNAPLDVIKSLMAYDRWLAYENRTDDFRAEDGQTNFIQAMLQFVARVSEDLSPYFPEISRIRIFTEEPDGGYFRDGTDFYLHFETGSEASYLDYPGFLRQILGQERFEFTQPPFVSRGRFRIVNYINIADVNLEPALDEESINLRWDEATNSLQLRIEFETRGEEVSGSVNLDWDRIAVVIRFVPSVREERLFWTPEVEVALHVDSILPHKRTATERIANGLRAQLQTYLEEIGAELMGYFLALPLRPMEDYLTETKRLSDLDILDFRPLENIIRRQGLGLEGSWAAFSENFIGSRSWPEGEVFYGSCLLPNNPLRSVFLRGEDPDYNFEFQPARFMDHYVRHISAPEILPDGASGANARFDVEPIGSHDYYDEQYLNDIVRREKYEIRLDHLILDPQEYGISPGVPTSWQIEWDVQVRHPRLASNRWATVKHQAAWINSHSSILDLAGHGMAVDWLETGGDMRIAGNIRRGGRDVAEFVLPGSPYYQVTEEIPLGRPVLLRNSTPTITAVGRLARITTLNGKELDWVRLILREVFVELDNPVDYFLQRFGHPPEGRDTREWLTQEILTRLHVIAYLNGEIVSITNFNEEAARRVLMGMSCTFPEDYCTFDVYFDKNNEDAAFDLRVVLADVPEDTCFDEDDITPWLSLSERVFRSDPAFPGTEWRVPFGAPSVRFTMAEEDNPMSIDVSIMNMLPSEPPLEYVPKPYDIIFTNIHVRRGTPREWSRDEMDFWVRMWSETDGARSDEEEKHLDYIHDNPPLDRPQADVPFFQPEVAVGSTIHISVRGREYDLFVDDPLGTAEHSLVIPSGDDLDRNESGEDFIHTSEPTDYFSFQFRARTSAPPKGLVFEPEDAIVLTNLERILQGKIHELELEVGRYGSWSFSYGVAWAESFALQFSNDISVEEPVWEDLPDYSSLRIGEVVNQTIEAPDSGQREGFYRLCASNAAGDTFSKVLFLRV